MDELKIAFETIVVGLLAFPWLALGIYLFARLLRSGSRSRFDFLGGYLPAAREFASKAALLAGGVVLLAIAYAIGSMVNPLADGLFDRHRVVLPSDDCTKLEVFRREYREKPYLLVETAFPEVLYPAVRQLRATLGSTRCDPGTLQHGVRPLYEHEKYTIFAKLPTGTDILLRIENQIIVLRGATFNALLTLAFCLVLTVVDLVPVGWSWKRTLGELRKLRRGKDRNGAPVLISSPHDPAAPDPHALARELIPRFAVVVLVIPMSILTLGFGAYGVLRWEQEFDKNVVRLYHAIPAPPTGVPAGADAAR